MLSLMQTFNLYELVIFILINLAVGQETQNRYDTVGTECSEAVPCSLGYVCSSDGVCLPEMGRYPMRKNALYNNEEEYVSNKNGDINDEDRGYDSDYDDDDDYDDDYEENINNGGDSSNGKIDYDDDEEKDDDYGLEIDSTGDEHGDDLDDDIQYKDNTNDDEFEDSIYVIEDTRQPDIGTTDTGTADTDKDQFVTDDRNEVNEDRNEVDEDRNEVDAGDTTVRTNLDNIDYYDLDQNNVNDDAHNYEYGDDDLFDTDTVYDDDTKDDSNIDIFDDDRPKDKESDSVSKQDIRSNNTNDMHIIEPTDKAIIDAGLDSTDTTLDSRPSNDEIQEAQDSMYGGDGDDVMSIDDGTQDYTITYNLDSDSLEPIKKVRRPKRTTNVFHPEFPTTYDMKDFKLKKSTCIRLPKGYTQETIRALIEKNEMENSMNMEEPMDEDAEMDSPQIIDDMINETPEIMEDDDDFLPPDIANDVYDESSYPNLNSNDVDIDIGDPMVSDNDLDIDTTGEDLTLQLSDDENYDDSVNNMLEDVDIEDNDNMAIDQPEPEMFDSLLSKDLSQEERKQVIKIVKHKLDTVIQEANKALETLETVRVKRSNSSNNKDTEENDHEYEIGTEKTEEVVKRDVQAAMASPEVESVEMAWEQSRNHGNPVHDKKAQQFADQYVTNLLSSHVKRAGVGPDSKPMLECMRRQMKRDMRKLRRYAKYYLKKKFRMDKEYLPLSWLELNMRIREYIDSTWETTDIDDLDRAKETIRAFIDNLYNDLRAKGRPNGDKSDYGRSEDNPKKARKKGRFKGNRMLPFRRRKMKNSSSNNLQERIDDMRRIPDEGITRKRIMNKEGRRHRNRRSFGSLPLGGNILGAFTAANAVSEAGEKFQERVAQYSNHGRSYFNNGGNKAAPTMTLMSILVFAVLIIAAAFAS